jgi:uncharacterized protein (TIGR02646 family)
MKYIEKLKNNEPSSLILHKRTPHHNYDNYDSKDELRLVLLREQGYLCCYCMRRIQAPIASKMKIEHFKAESIYNGTNGNPDLTLDYMNLFASCKGSEHKADNEHESNKSNESKANKNYHCDKTKGSLDCPICPTNKADMDAIRFYSDGSIKYSGDESLNVKIENVLHLNRKQLVEDRKQVWKAAEDFLRRKSTKADINRLLTKFSKTVDGKLEPYCQVTIYYLSRKLHTFVK